MLFNTDQVEVQQLAAGLKLLSLDVDGVLTDGRLYFSADGEAMKAFSILDGQGIKLLQRSGVRVAIITGRQSSIVARRAEELGIELLFQGREDKHRAIQELSEKTGIAPESIACVGDDLPDIAAMKSVALGFAVANAHAEVRRIAQAQTTLAGGRGAVREVCDFVLRAQGRYDEALAPYLQTGSLC